MDEKVLDKQVEAGKAAAALTWVVAPLKAEDLDKVMDSFACDQMAASLMLLDPDVPDEVKAQAMEYVKYLEGVLAFLSEKKVMLAAADK